MSDNKNEQKILIDLNGAIHDLNNIFTSNLASIEQLQNMLPDNENFHSLLTGLSINYTRATEIINSLSPASQKLKSRISIEDIITDVQSTVKLSLEERIKLKISIEKNIPKIEGYYIDLYRALLNITINAIESIDDEGLIEITAKTIQENKFIEILISDTGSGISDENLPFIFDDKFSTKERGSGDGLAIIKKIIDEQKGTISAKNNEQSGTTFSISIPALPVFQKTSPGKNTQSILLVDDDKTILELLSDLLLSYDYNVVSADCGKDALKEFYNYPNFELIIVDKTIPDIDGLDLINKFREKNSKVPIILTSGSHEIIDQDLSDFMINKKIKKPFNFEQLLDEIQNLLI